MVWSSLKQFLGFTGAAIKLEVASPIHVSEGLVRGRLTLTTERPQTVVSVEYRLEELWTTGEGAETESREFELGILRRTGRFQLEPGQPFVDDFDFPFEPLHSWSDELVALGGDHAAVGRVSKIRARERSVYKVVADVDFEGTPFDPIEEVEVEVVP